MKETKRKRRKKKKKNEETFDVTVRGPLWFSCCVLLLFSFFLFGFFLRGGGENTRTKDIWTESGGRLSAPAFTFSKGASAFPRTGTGHAALLFHTMYVSASRKESCDVPFFVVFSKIRLLGKVRCCNCDCRVSRKLHARKIARKIIRLEVLHVIGHYFVGNFAFFSWSRACLIMIVRIKLIH